MLQVKEKVIVNMPLTGISEGHARTNVQVRDVVATIDEPVARGGTNLGPTPTEMLGASLLGCTTVIANRIAARMGLTLQGLHMSLDMTFDRRGVNLAEEVDVPFPAMQMAVQVITEATPEEIEQLRAELRKYCPISKVLRAAGTCLEESWDIRRP